LEVELTVDGTRVNIKVIEGLGNIGVRINELFERLSLKKCKGGGSGRKQTLKP
jgi:hypothetical protein